MTTSSATTAALRDEQVRLRSLRDEAAIEPDAVATSAPTKATQVIAIYGKGGIGKSATTSNISAALADAGHRVIQIGCDPKSDSTNTLRGGQYIPTVLDTIRTKTRVALEDVVFEGYAGVYCVEAGGPLQAWAARAAALFRRSRCLNNSMSSKIWAWMW